MPKVEIIQEKEGAIAHFICPGCCGVHAQYIRPYRNAVGASWDWNGGIESPTFTPSIYAKTEYTEPGRSPKVCHSFVTNGWIRFLGDCTHDLAGQSLELPEITD
jgi:hypothetical protein